MNRETRMRAKALLSDETYKSAVAALKERANKELLNAKTPEEREEKWRDYQALSRVMVEVAKWAAEAKTQADR